MSDGPSPPEEPEEAERRWRPIGRIDRRVAGVLVEKAKTTPDAYPMTLNAICNACNQKSNRAPVMQLEPDDVEESLDRLREMGAVGLIEGHGRVQKYRHYLYKWLDVDAVELAVLAELLLRGAQTQGELRSRAARMEPIADLAALRPVLESLKSKGLIVPLTPEGRGHVLTHGLYPPEEMEKVRRQYAEGAPVDASTPAAVPLPSAAPVPASAPPAVDIEARVAEAVGRQMGEFRDQLAQIRAELEDLSEKHDRLADEVRELKDALGG